MLVKGGPGHVLTYRQYIPLSTGSDKYGAHALPCFVMTVRVGVRIWIIVELNKSVNYSATRYYIYRFYHLPKNIK